MKKSAYMPKSKNQEHLTPDRVFEIIESNWGYKKEIFFDPFPVGTPFKAPIFFNAFYMEWQKYNYVNSPFEKIILEQAVKKAFNEALKGKITIMLLPTKTDQDWFHDIILKFFRNNILWIRKRLKFKNDKHHATDTHFLVKVAFH